MPEYDLAVIGGGSGGIGAALAAARLGLSVALIEAGECLGGTAVLGGVSLWEPGVGGTGIPLEIYARLSTIPDAVGVYSFGRHCLWPREDDAPVPGGEHVVDPARTYADTLRRFGSPDPRSPEGGSFRRDRWHGLVFEPDAYARVVAAMLNETGRCEVFFNRRIVDAAIDGARVSAVALADGSTLSADAFIDATGDVALCRAAGCETMFGQDARERFNEPSAPATASGDVNAVTLVYRAEPADRDMMEPLPDGIPGECWWRSTFPFSSITHYPSGGLNVNMLPTMSGAEFVERGPAEGYAECLRRVRAHWHWMQADYPEYRAYRFAQAFSMPGVRESWRTVTETILTENEITAGLSRQKEEGLIALADHAMDRHGEGGGCVELDEPYGIPFGCLVPKGMENLLVACRGAGFSSLAASSCRLSRTMMQLGQAAGTACALAAETGCAPSAVNTEQLRDSLSGQGVQLAWPMEDAVRARVPGV